MRDWIGSPREWGEWGMRATAWFNELVDEVNSEFTSLLTRVGLLESNRVGYAVASLATANVGTGATAVNDLSVSATLVSGKKYKVSFSTHCYGNTTNDVIRYRIVGPSSPPWYASWDRVIGLINNASAVSGYFVFTAGASGSTTFFLQHYRGAGTGTVYNYADAVTTRYTFLTVEPFQ